MTIGAFSIVIPPIATIGREEAFLTDVINPVPEAGPASFFVDVLNMGLTPR
jgi:hypothetical protein